MGNLNGHALRLTMKLMAIGLVTGFLTWYLMENPSTPGGLAIFVWVIAFFGMARAILSEAESFVVEPETTT